MGDLSSVGGDDPDIGKGFVGTFGVVVVGMAVRGRANWDQNDGLFGYMAMVFLGEHNQVLQDMLEQGINGRVGDRRHRCLVGAWV